MNGFVIIITKRQFEKYLYGTNYFRFEVDLGLDQHILTK